MTREPVTEEWLLDARLRILARIRELIDTRTRDFLVSIEREVPAFNLIDLPHATDMPGVRRKLQNLVKRTPEKREADYRNLIAAFDRIGSQSVATPPKDKMLSRTARRSSASAERAKRRKELAKVRERGFRRFVFPVGDSLDHWLAQAHSSPALVARREAGCPFSV